ncbi:hypothetical protein B566_EDAN007353 [Ephemera danica]|nr:hypothetical protein B566_EDAN007353 [Ephemera danica]
MWSSLFGSSSPEMKFGSEVTFILNGVTRTVGSELSSSTSLNLYIRDVAQLTGTKNLCYEGDCGACIVAATVQHPVLQQKQTFAVNSCLVPVFACHGWEITTVEGLGDRHTGYHPIQAALAQFNGTQCGFCSPGMVMNMYSLSKDKPPTMAEVENAFSGNLCRCTGYRSILDAFKSLATDATPALKRSCADIEDLYKICSKTGKACSGSCKPIEMKPIQVKPKAEATWYKVTTLDGLTSTLNTIGDVPYKLVAGNTAEGVYRSSGIEAYIDIKDVPELRSHVTTPSYKLGGNVTLTEAMNIFKSATAPDYLYLKQLADHINRTANVAVNNGTLSLLSSDIFFLEYIRAA